MAKRRKRAHPLAIFWSLRDQRRFIDAVERLVHLVFELEKHVHFFDVMSETITFDRPRRKSRKSDTPMTPEVNHVEKES